MIFNPFKWGRAAEATDDSLPASKLEAQQKHRSSWSGWLASFWQYNTVSPESLSVLRKALIKADVGLVTANRILDLLQSRHRQNQDVKELLRQILKEVLAPSDSPLVINSAPEVIMLVGVNGAGKTTAAAKLTHYFKSQHKKVMLAAGDTFRAGAIDQLKVWGDRLSTPVIAQKPGSDSASVIFDAYQAAQSQQVDILITDTAGRLQNKTNLMQELEKVQRVLKKKNPLCPQQTWLVLDATVGQNGLEQAKVFHQTLPLTGVVLNKIDGTAKGGIVFSISDQLNLPVRFLGTGERTEDLLPFDSTAFVGTIMAAD